MTLYRGRERRDHEWAGATVCFDAERDVSATSAQAKVSGSVRRPAAACQSSAHSHLSCAALYPCLGTGTGLARSA